MANASLFPSKRTRHGRCDAVNDEGAPAFARSPKHALAQYAATGCLNDTFYTDAEHQLGRLLALGESVEVEFVAKAAVYCRERSFMKDAPALLCAILSRREPELFERVFDRVIDNGKMLRTFVQIMRSGACGRSSLGTRPKRLVQRWFDRRSDEAVFRASVGQAPSLKDIVRMVHPKPKSRSRSALFAWLCDRPHEESELPELVQHYSRFKRGDTPELPDVPFQMLTSLPLGPHDWAQIARRAPWQMTRMNLNTFARHGVFEDARLTEIVAARLADAALVARSRAFPYQLMVAHLHARSGVPDKVRKALGRAMEAATGNVPAIPGKVFVCPDVSGSMHWPITGYRRGASTAVRCVDVAALVTAAIVRRNPTAEVLPFTECTHPSRVQRDASILDNARILASYPAGGTNCSAPLAQLNRAGARGDLVIFVSDNESWVDGRSGRSTRTLREWERFKKRNPRARLACIDVQPHATTQAPERSDILNVGGFSDQVFEVLRAFAAGELSSGHVTALIERVEL